jgi:multidrug efflux pump subunit AcrB
MRIRTPAGDEVPFDQVAAAEHGRGYATIQRVDRARSLHVTCKVDDKRSKYSKNDIAGLLATDFLPKLAIVHPGLQWAFEGSQRNQAETLGALAQGFLVVLFLIYALMAIPLKSYLQPLIVMTAIPFGFVGAVFGHVVIGLDLTILSMFGLVALAGVAVNDSLVLVEFINQLRREGTPLRAAVTQASMIRFRAVMLTSGTTFVGLLPLVLNKSVQAQFLIPMGVSLAFGSVFATFVSLLLVPSLYLILEDLRFRRAAAASA